ncbi:MAG: hypothetical protein M4579_003054 [Chaenotheca gracillima]|nr:MAG: hypothetical protein M4579_003054 [Chaenotheca gracillima]
MNTIKSVWYGWGTLIVAGGGAYYFAKRSINAERDARHEEEMSRRRRIRELELSYIPPTHSGSGSKKSKSSTSASAASGGADGGGAGVGGKRQRENEGDFAESPSQEASHDPAPTRHAPENEGQRVEEKGKYEASVPYRAKKGDRFS